MMADVLEFDHHLLREVVLAERDRRWSERQAQRVRHRCLAGAKQRQVEQGDRGLLPEVAHHYLEAREWAEAVRYHQAAGAAARDSLAFRDAAGFYATAVRLLGEHPGLPLAESEQVELYSAAAEVFETLGQMPEALSAYRAAQQHTGENRVRWAQMERCIAWLLSRTGKLDEAVAACERARDIVEAEGAETDLADSLRTLGVINILRSRFDTAMEHLQQALAIYQRAAPSEGLARCYDYMAYLYQEYEDREAMLDATRHSLAICEQLGDPVAIGRALNNVAWVLVLMGRDAEALPLLRRVVEIFERHRCEKDLPNVYHSLAEVLLKSDQADEAMNHMARGMELARHDGDARTVADFHRLLARHAAATQSSDARVHFEEALHICGETNLEPQKAQILLEYGELLLQVDSPKEALLRFEEALAILRRLGVDKTIEAETAITRARDVISSREISFCGQKWHD
jgi:tetratricopeptide (TPR) repeat protein